MKILITTGLSKADIGGPFQYAPNLEMEFRNLGHKVKIVSYDHIERVLSPGVRHFYFFLRILASVAWADKVLTLDTYSVGIPTVWASKLFGKKVVARVGGDFLWSAYVNRTADPITLPTFYVSMPSLNFKEKLIFFFMRNMIRNTDFLAFNTEWQRNIWQSFYKIREGRSGVVRNFIPEKGVSTPFSKKNFIWAGRLILEKNPEMLKKFGIDMVTGESRDKVLERIKNSYVAVSLAYTDISPNFIIEAISFNKPFIMTRETGLSEMFPKGGIFVNPTDDKEVEMAIEAMLDDNTYNRYAEELKGITLKHSWKELAQEFMDIWNKL